MSDEIIKGTKVFALVNKKGEVMAVYESEMQALKTANQWNETCIRVGMDAGVTISKTNFFSKEDYA